MRVSSFWICTDLIRLRQSELTQLNITQTNQRSASFLTQRTEMSAAWKCMKTLTWQRL